MPRRLFLLLVLFAVSALLAGCGELKVQPHHSDLASLVANLQNGDDEASVSKAILASQHDRAQLYELLAAPREYARPAETGWSYENIELEANYMLGFGYYIPESYDPKHPYPVIITLHGAVGTREPYGMKQVANTSGGAYGELFAPSGEEYMVISPQGSYKAMWWTKNGLKMILGALEYVKRNYHVDTNRVFVIGFSDGGSASYFLAGTTPTPFAAFFSLNGHPAAADSAFHLFFHNMRNRPMLICNTTEDNLYPPQSILPFVNRLKSSGAEVSFHLFENIGHSPSYLDSIQVELVDWFKTRKRNPWRDTTEYASSDMYFNRCDWLTILERGQNASPCEVDDLSVSMPTPRRLGILQDMDYSGNGIRVASVALLSDAEKMGILAGDIIDSFNGVALKSPAELIRLIEDCSGAIKVNIRRGEVALELFGSLTNYPPRMSYDNLPMKAYAKAARYGNTISIDANGAKLVRIAVRPGFVDMDKPLVVYANGVKVFELVVSYDSEAILASWLEDHDPATLAAAYIIVEIP